MSTTPPEQPPTSGGGYDRPAGGPNVNFNLSALPVTPGNAEDVVWILATILIAIGGFIPGWTSGLNRFGITWSFFIGELLGVVLIFLGFLASIEVFSDVRLPFTRIVLRRRDQEEHAAG